MRCKISNKSDVSWFDFCPENVFQEKYLFYQDLIKTCHHLPYVMKHDTSFILARLTKFRLTLRLIGNFLMSFVCFFLCGCTLFRISVPLIDCKIFRYQILELQSESTETVSSMCSEKNLREFSPIEIKTKSENVALQRVFQVLKSLSMFK